MRIYRDYDMLGLSVMNDFTIDPATTALVVVDMQYASTHKDHGFQKLYQEIGMKQETSYFQDRLRDEVIPNIQRLLAGFREAGAHVVYLTVGSEREDYGDFCSRRLSRIDLWREKGVGVPYARTTDPSHAIIPQLQPQEGDLVINKTTASAFNSSSFGQTLNEQGITTLVFTGVGTNYCVEMTFRDASDRGFQCILVEDAAATSTREMHDRAVDTMTFYGRVVSADDVLNEVRQTVPVADGSTR